MPAKNYAYAAALCLLAACGTKTPLQLPPGAPRPPLLGGPAAVPGGQPAPNAPAAASAVDNSSPAEKR